MNIKHRNLLKYPHSKFIKLISIINIGTAIKIVVGLTKKPSKFKLSKTRSIKLFKLFVNPSGN